MFQLLLAVIYLSFISLGLPDALLGASWPTMYQQFDVPISYAGIISMTIAGGTIISSLQSDRVTKKFGPGKVTAFSVLMTAVALFGFSISTSFWMLFLWAIPYGLGAGSVDASLNNYVALHYESRHMSWLHCMWGVGASTGPYILSFALANGHGWNMGYRYISIIQIVLTAIIMFSLPLWKNRTTENNMISDGNTIEDQGEKSDSYKVLSLKEIISIPGAKPIMLIMLTYCALEQTAGLWASSYLVLKHGLDAELAAGFGSLFYIGITVGRAISGFVTMRLNDNQMIRLGQALALVGIVLMFLPLGHQIALIGLIIIGLGGAPIYPCVIHSTPENFGAEKSQAIIGVQMASAYVGTLAMPAIFGFIANHLSVALFPFYLLVILLVMFTMHVKLLRIVKSNI